MPQRARVLLSGTIALGALTVLVASFRTGSGSLRLLAVLAAAAALGVLAADSLARVPLHKVAYNASVFSLAALAGGFAFESLGGVPGTPSLPHDFPALCALVATAYAVNTLLI